MLIFTGYPESFSSKAVTCVSLLLRSSRVYDNCLSLPLPPDCSSSPPHCYIRDDFKNLLREVLAETLSEYEVKKALYASLLCNNSAVFVAPMLDVAPNYFSFIETILLALIFASAGMVVAVLRLVYAFLSNKAAAESLLTSIRATSQDIMINTCIRRLLLLSFFCFSNIVMFITATMLLDKINPDIGM